MAYMEKEDWEKLVRERAFNGPSGERTQSVLDHIIDYDSSAEGRFWNCTLKVAFSSWHHGMLERFPIGHKFECVSFVDNIISFYNSKGVISRHHVGVYIGPQITDRALEKGRGPAQEGKAS